MAPLRIAFFTIFSLLAILLSLYSASNYLEPQHKMAEHLYISETPDEVKNAKGLHLITQSTPNGQKVQILLEELADTYGTKWTTTLINISTNEQKKGEQVAWPSCSDINALSRMVPTP